MKLGGSVITKKERLLTPNSKTILRLAGEIKHADVKPLIIVHGGGSFGHPYAKKYKLAEGYENSEQLIGFSKTHQAMASLNRLVVDALIQKNIPAVAVQPSAFILTRGGRIIDLDSDLILRMLTIELVPVLYGDITLDEVQGFSVLSGDQLVAALAIAFETRQVIICVDVDGLYTEDPKLNPNAQLIKKISLEELKAFLGKISQSVTTDVTGGMHGKISELIPTLERGIAVKVMNAKRSNRLYKTLINEEVKGTKIEP